MAVYIGVDLHTRTQMVCWCDTADGEIHEQELEHEAKSRVREFYQQFGPVVVGVESVGYAAWFHRLMDELGHELLVGNSQGIRSRAPRKQKNDRRDARLILDLLLRDDFPTVYRPAATSQQILGLLRYRHRLVKMRTMVKNGLQAVAMNEGLRLKARLWTKSGQQRLEELELEPAGAWQRQTSLELLDTLASRIEGIEADLAERTKDDPQVARLQTHPGVGLLTSVAVVHSLGPVARFARTRHVAAYFGFDPAEQSSGERQRFGHISKQGSRLVRFLLGQAALAALGEDEPLRAFYHRLLSHRHKHPGVAVTATARKLLIHLFVMLRDQIDYTEFRRRGRDARCARERARPASAVPVSLIGPPASL
jgi:transposase